MNTDIIVGLGSCGIASGAQEVYDYFEKNLDTSIALKKTSCIGICFQEPIVEVVAGGVKTVFGKVDVAFAEKILDGVKSGKLPEANRIFEDEGTNSFVGPQVKIALKNCGKIDPENIEDYIATGGYEGIRKALTMTGDQVIDLLKESGLKGRGGAGFLTGQKWAFLKGAKGDKKYLVCNADEGDPGAFMDRAILEGDPHSVVEGMLIGAWATGADEGYIYCRAEYPLALKRLKIAIAEAEKRNLLGKNILGSGKNFVLHVKEGAGAFVCGEETALIASIEGKRGMPHLRPPFPAESGVNSKPTNINNVETYANVPRILVSGAASFNKYSYGQSFGTKVFALAGKVKRVGLVEVPMGLTIREIVEKIGGGSSTGLPLKAVQMGGPAGGCIPESLFDTPIDYASIGATGAIMGSGGMIVMDSSSCMVDVAKYFLQFTQAESCGKCTFCRIGTKRMMEILERITQGQGTMEDLALLEELADVVGKSSLCGLGQLAPNPVKTTLRYFKDEYIAHIKDKKCPAGVCKSLITIDIEKDKCKGCTACSKVCPVQAITGSVKKPHVIDPAKCVRCKMCIEKCKFGAIRVI
ncbi:MAG: NADH-quinone oxidoreductase subunit NuoF [Spirochaetia bacterium]|nr:NADH-quinone oxidoreductase subunit NuoF [Spirochaetia bacterium]MBQ3713137.1 NADH-quinone oxidoreductase subunit NuoF [Spirochaetia bacterium]